MAPRPILPRPWRVLTAAAQQIKLDIRGKAMAPKREQWQTDAWDMADLIPEVGQAATFMANVVAGVRLYVGVRPDDEGEVPAPAGLSVPGAVQANDLLRRMRDGSAAGGLSGLLYLSVWNLKIPGECWLLSEPELVADPLARPPRPAQRERWDVRSIDEIKIERGFAALSDKPGDKGRRLPLPPDDPTAEVPPDAVFLWRVWDRHPRYAGLARSSLRAALNQCDELLLLGRAVRVGVRRFLAGNGMVVVPQELDLPTPPSAGDAAEDANLSPLMRKLGEAMVQAMVDESNPDSLVPILTMGPGELLQKVQHIKFGSALDAEVRALLEATRKRLLDGLDLPVEQVTGIGQANHWNAWMVDSATWGRYGEPCARLIVNSWTEGLWPLLEEGYGVPADAARRLCLWFDPAAAIMDPDESKTADELLEHGAIGWGAYRRRKGANEDEAPTPEELDLMAQLGILRGRSGGGGPVPNGGEATTASANGNGWHPLPPVRALTAGDGRSLGRRLMEIDRTLRIRLEEGAEAAIRRALSLAGARVRSRAQGNANITAALAGVPNHAVPSRLGPTVLEALLAAADMTTDDLLAGGVEDFEARFLALVGAAQGRTLDLLMDELDLSESEQTELRQRQDQERSEAWAWLAGALLAVARVRMHDPNPAPPGAGEHVPSSTVDIGTIREAMARAGGGGSPSVAPGPSGGVATGVDVMDLWARHGQVVSGWEWVYGHSSVNFPAHLALDGVSFETWTDPVLLVQADDAWLGVSHYRPGDHRGCQCDFIALAVETQAASAGVTHA